MPRLWAHQLRRDLAHFVRNNEQTQDSITSALGTTSNMQQAVTQLKQLVEHLHEENKQLWETMQMLNQRLVDKQGELDTSVQRHSGLIDSFSIRINSLGEKMGVVEKFCGKMTAEDESSGSITAAMRMLEFSDEIQRLGAMEEQQRDEEVNENYSGCSSGMYIPSYRVAWWFLGFRQVHLLTGNSSVGFWQ